MININKINKRFLAACIIMAFLVSSIATLTTLPPAKASNPLNLQPFTLTITGNNGETVTLTQNNITALPTTTGLGGYTKTINNVQEYFNIGTYTGVSLQYLANLVGGIKSEDDINIQDVNTPPQYAVDLTYPQITNAASKISSWYNPTTGKSQTPTSPITFIIPYEFSNSTYSGPLPSHWGDFGSVSGLIDMAVGSQGLVTWGDMMCYLVDTITVDNGNNGMPYLTYNTCTSAGVAQTTFNPGSNVYFTATGLSASTSYNIYAVPYQSAWFTGMAIPTPVSTTRITTDSSGDLAATSIYTSAAAGQYDIVVKPTSESDGTYDVSDVLLTNAVGTPGPGFAVATPLAAPTASASPTAVDQGQSSTLTSTAVTTGVSPYTYQWLSEAPGASSFTAISGATSSSYNFATSTSTPIGIWNFELQVTDSTNTVVTSNTASVTVNSALIAPTVSASVNTVDQGQSSSLTSTTMSTGTPTYTYQWFSEAPGASSYTAISGATSASYNFVTSASTVTGNWNFELQVTDNTGAVVTSNVALVTVNPGVFTMPEYGLGALAAFGACFASFIAFIALKKISISPLGKNAHALRALHKKS